MSYIADYFDEEVVRLLQNGGVGFMPSDTTYGLSCRALDKRAVERIYKLKKRQKDKPFIVLISGVEQLKDFGIITTDGARVFKYWPGKLTMIYEAPKAPAWLHRGTKTLAVRWPKDATLQKLIGQVGPIVSTSANLAGQLPITSAKAAQKVFGTDLDFYVDVGRLKRQPSTIVRPVFAMLEVLRQGSVKIRKRDKK